MAESICKTATRTRIYGERLLDKVTQAQAARKPRFGGVVIDCNHPTFVYGHLAIYPQRVLTLLGLEVGNAAAPASYTDLFKAGVECKDDVEGTIYPSLAEVSALFLRATDDAIAKVATVDDAIFARETPDERARASFPTLGTATIFLLNNHAMMHLGQVSTWRRCFGLPSAS
ncbi:MAG: DinB family protein [Planctomycetota bacterium]|nr:DinB family protein [Planctomycetota bacterium]